MFEVEIFVGSELQHQTGRQHRANCPGHFDAGNFSKEDTVHKVCLCPFHHPQVTLRGSHMGPFFILA